MSDPATELGARIDEGSTPQRIADLLDGLAHDDRVTAIRSLGRKRQRGLYALVDGFRPLELTDLVPTDRDDAQPVRHFGRNTLPAFTHFEKRMLRPRGVDREKPDTLWGYNFQTLEPLTGPGYFVARPSPDRPEVLVDYNLVPSAQPEGWPGVRRNEAGISRFVYGFMIDTLRGVSEHVSIGSAARKGRDMGSWFVLCREP